MVQLGAEFLIPVPDEFKKGPDPTVTLLQEIRAALVALPHLVASAVQPAPFPELPRPIVHVDEPDLSAIVTAVNGLKPNSTPREIAAEIVKQINPVPQTDQTVVVEAMRELIDKIDFRLQGVGRAFGASGPSNISDNKDRLLGHVTVDSLPAITTTPVANPATGSDFPVLVAVTNTAVNFPAHPLSIGAIVQALAGNSGIVKVGFTNAPAFELQAGQATSAGVANSGAMWVNGAAGDGVCVIGS